MIARQLQDILGSMQDGTREQFGEDFHVSESSDWYRENFPIAMAFKVMEDKILDVFSNMNLRTAKDPYFFENSSNFLFQRKMPSKAKGWIKTTDSVIGATAKIGQIKLKKKGTDLIYTNTEEITVHSLPFEFEVQSQLTGSITNANLDEVTEIVSVPPNWGKFTNSSEIAGGQDIETLEEARKRFFNNGASQAYWNEDGVRAELLKVEGVKSVFVKVNNSDNAFSDGQPRRSLWCVVEGGRDSDIAEAIFLKFTDATYTYGSTRVNVKSISGEEIEIGFDRPTNVVVDIHVQVLGIANTESIKAEVQDYLDTVSVGGVVSSSKALDFIDNYKQYQDIAIFFKKQGTTTWNSFVQLGSTEKAIYGVV
ncbi:MAG: baseplate J/gp47 family protein [Cetobacterium sp.]